MHVFEFVLGIILITTIGSIIRSRHKHRHAGGHHDEPCSYCGMGSDDDYGLGGRKKKGSEEDPNVTIKLSRLEKMEQRLITLEKIITDKGYNLSEEIENL